MEELTQTRISNVGIAVLNVFELPNINTVSKTQFEKKLNKAGFNVSQSNQHLADFKTADAFFLGALSSADYFRVCLPGYSFQFPRFSNTQGSVIYSSIEADIILTVFPKINIANLTTNLRVEDYSVDELIFLMQCLDGKDFAFNVSCPDCLEKDSENTHLSKIGYRYIQKITSLFGGTATRPNTISARVIEMDKYVEYSEIEPEQTLEISVHAAYGLLTLDEGWRFVPSSAANKVKEFTWSTRGFFLAVPFGNSLMAINTSGSETHQNYIKTQQKLREGFGFNVEAYFQFDPKIAGLNHGAYSTMELAAIQYFILTEVKRKTNISEMKMIKELLNQQEALLAALGSIQKIDIPALGNLGRNVRDAMGIPSVFEEVTRRLQEVETILTLKYNRRVNNLVIILAIIPILIAIIEGLIS